MSVLYSAVGDWTDVAFNAANFTASTGSWTLSSPDQVTFRYMEIGHLMIVEFDFSTTTVSATPASLRFAIPNGKTAAKDVAGKPYLYQDNAASDVYGNAVMVTGANVVRLFTLSGANFSVSTNLTRTYGLIAFETQ